MWTKRQSGEHKKIVPFFQSKKEYHYYNQNFINLHASLYELNYICYHLKNASLVKTQIWLLEHAR